MYKNCPTRVREATGTDGMVATAHPAATLHGVRVLLEGGNALDAAVTAAAVTWVVRPHMCGVGGDAFILYHDAASGKTACYCGCGRAPRSASLDAMTRAGVAGLIPLEGPLGVTVPGALHAFSQALKDFGTIELGRALQPAATIAENGFIVTPGLSEHMALHREKIARFPSARCIFLDREGSPLMPGAVLKQPDLGRTLRTIAREGPEAFYQGEIAEAMCSWVRSHGGFLDLDDMAEHSTSVEEPLVSWYRGRSVYVTGLPSQGFITLEALNVLEEFPGADGAARAHVLIEAVKAGFLDRLRFAQDPEFDGRVDEIFASREHASLRKKHIDLSRASPKEGWPEWADADWLSRQRTGDTTFIATVDVHGNACSLIHSLALSFGSGVVVPGTGVLLNNRGARSFTLNEKDPNRLEPLKRPMHTLMCYMVFKAGRLEIVGGTPGGDGQVQWNSQILDHMLSRGAGPQEAVEHPRWTVFPGSDSHVMSSPSELRMEVGFPNDVVDGLRKRGHKLVLQSPWEGGGGAQVIVVDDHRGILRAGSDPRVEGLALGF